MSANSRLANAYELTSIEAVSTPAGLAGSHWHRYEISQGANRIVGYRQGALRTVRTAVEAIVVQLNERRDHRPGRVHIALGPGRRR